MKKILFKIFLFLIFPNICAAKTLDVGLHKLELPNKFYLISYSDLDVDFAKDLCKEFPICYAIVDKTVKEILDEISVGKDLDNIKVLKPIISSYQKVLNSADGSLSKLDRAIKGLIKKFKSTFKNNNSGILYNYLLSDVDLSEDKYLSEYDIDINDIRQMSLSELKKYSSDIKNQITGGKNSYMISDSGIFVDFKKFQILKNSKNIPYFIFNGKITFLPYTKGSKITIANYVVYLSEVDNKLFMFDGVCVVKCSNFFSNFNSIIEKSFNKETLTGTVLNSQDNNLIKQLEQLNNLYKSGVLTKEEFEKAKKKILN